MFPDSVSRQSGNRENGTGMLNTLALAVNSLMVVVSALFFLHGSFEMVPNAEQQEKARIAEGLLFFLFLAVEILLVAVMKKTSKLKSRK